MQEENDIDQLFRNGLDDPGIPFNEMDWERMERKLDAKEKKRISPIWLFTAGSIAAALVIGLLWVFMISEPPIKQHTDQPDGNQAAIRKTAPAQPILPGGVTAQQVLPAGTINKEFPSGNISPAIAEKASLAAIKANPQNVFQLKQVDHQPATFYPLQPGVMMNALTAGTIAVKTSPITVFIPMATETDSSIVARKADALARSVDPLHQPDHAEIARAVKKKMDNTLDKKPDLILTAMAAPDISTTRSSKPSKLSSNFGVLATYALSRKISFTSGAVYAKKIYNSGGVTPGGYANSDTEWEVKANCDVIDVPVNINYKLLSMKKMSVSINTGLSSYFMLKERYEFINGQAGGQQQVSNLEITNENRHLMGIANVSVTFDHKISESVSIGIQPFAKLPLTGIGNGDVNLRSTGMSFSLNIGLFPAKKQGKYAVLYP